MKGQEGTHISQYSTCSQRLRLLPRYPHRRRSSQSRNPALMSEHYMQYLRAVAYLVVAALHVIGIIIIHGENGGGSEEGVSVESAIR